jgi:hypothetical protein
MNIRNLGDRASLARSIRPTEHPIWSWARSALGVIISPTKKIKINNADFLVPIPSRIVIIFQ